MPPLEVTADLRICWGLENWSPIEVSLWFPVFSCCLARAPFRREPHRQLADGVDEIVRRHFDAAGIFDVRQPRQQLAVDFLELQLRHALADADMRAEAEGDVLRRIGAADVERSGSGNIAGSRLAAP